MCASCSGTRALFIYLSWLPQIRVHCADISRLPPTAGPRVSPAGSSRHTQMPSLPAGSGWEPAAGRRLLRIIRAQGHGLAAHLPLRSPQPLHLAAGWAGGTQSAEKTPCTPNFSRCFCTVHWSRFAPEPRRESPPASTRLFLSWVQDRRPNHPSRLLPTCPWWGQQRSVSGPVPRTCGALVSHLRQLKAAPGLWCSQGPTPARWLGTRSCFPVPHGCEAWLLRCVAVQCQAQRQQDRDPISCSTTARGAAQRTRPSLSQERCDQKQCQVSTVSPQGNAGYPQTHRGVGGTALKPFPDSLSSLACASIFWLLLSLLGQPGAQPCSYV